MRFTIKDAIESLEVASRPISSVDISSDSAAFREHWQAIGALRVILHDIYDQEKEIVGLIGLVDSWPKSCGCGRTYGEIEWGTLLYAGVVADEDGSFELRKCTCGVTLSQSIECDPMSDQEGEEDYRVGPWRGRR